MAESAPVLEMRGITKRYPGVLANDAIDLDLRPGEIHALLGENGAGKSTLMNILYGLAVPDEGTILIDGQPVDILGPHDAIDRGISMVHQHFMLVPVLTVAENILLGEETMANPVFIDRNEASRRIMALGRAVRLRDRPRRQDRQPVGRLAAAGRDPEGALPQGAHPRPRRADRRPHPPGDRGDLRRPAPPGGGRPFDHLHQPQALRGPRDRRSDHGHPARPGRRPADPIETNEDDLAELMVGRERPARPSIAASRIRPTSSCRSRGSAPRTTAGARSSTGSISRSGLARPSASPASRATARTSSSRS